MLHELCCPTVIERKLQKRLTGRRYDRHKVPFQCTNGGEVSYVLSLSACWCPFFLFRSCTSNILNTPLSNWSQSAFNARNYPQDSTQAHLASLGQIHNLKPHPSTSPAESISPFSLNNNNLIALWPCWAARFYMKKIQKYKVKAVHSVPKCHLRVKHFLQNFGVKLRKWKCQVIEDCEMVGEPERKEKKRKFYWRHRTTKADKKNDWRNADQSCSHQNDRNNDGPQVAGKLKPTEQYSESKWL